ncbi:apolipophorins, partial [Orussus abietinus]|uniref:apolipophorins n=1 Tax=Orussus abietinus TaxID=222816 RepID=UPI000C715B2C
QPSKAYQEGQTYVYDLEGTSVTSVSEAQGEARLKLNAVVELSIRPDCARQLRLKNVRINDTPVALKDLEQYALQFNQHDGHIDNDVCAEPGDSQTSLNIKRAIISLFQTAVIRDSGATTHQEVDVFGGCPTDFSFRKTGDTLVVQKFRNLNQCLYRENLRQGLITSAFDSHSDIKSVPLLASQQKVEQQFKRGILNKAVSKETYNYKPFSNGDAGAKTVVETTVSFKSQSASGPAALVSEAKTLIFEVPHPVVKSSANSIVSALKALKDEEADGAVKPQAARRFSELVKVLRTSTKNDILSVYQRVKSGAGFDENSDKKILLDALFRTGSGEAAEVCLELIRNKEITGVQALVYYSSLAFLRHVNLPSVVAVTSLLDQPDLPRIGYLGIGHLIGKYCNEHNCRDVPEVKAALSKILSKVGNGKPGTRDKENVVISAIKALGNVGYLDNPTIHKLANIAANKKAHNRVRVAAIEALPSTCSIEWQNVLLKVIADREEDSEIRIKSYLSLVACPSSHVANVVKEVLDEETVNQFGSFVTSHLRNLRASVDPDKQLAKKYLENIKPRTKFPEDFRKFSFNNEFSYHADALGFGSSAESNVIYSQNSFVPRSASLNLTTEIFGHTFNFLELDARVENLDRLIEHYFGPKGHFRHFDPKEFVAHGSENVAGIVKLVKERFQKSIGRGRRDVSQGDLDKFAKNVYLRGNEVDEDLDVDLSIKLFGAELAFLSYQNTGKKWTIDRIVDKVFDGFDQGLNKVKDFNYDFENHLHFLDVDLVYPTGLGLPLSLGVTGTAVAHLKTNGKIDLPTIFKDPKNAAIRVALEPSASIRIAGNLVVEGPDAEAGLKVITVLHTATGSDVSVKFLDGNGIDVNFGIPKRKQELISISSEVVVSSGPKGEKYIQPKFGKGREHSDCFEQFSSILGLTICGHISYPYDSLESVQKRPFYPLSGPAKFSVSIENNDVTSYHFKVYYDKKNPKARSLEVLLETPNSRTDRKLLFLVEGATEPEKFIRVSLDSPIKKASLEGRLVNNPQERTLTLTAKHDQIEYFVRAGVLANGNKYKPVLEYKVPEHVERLAGSKSGTKVVHREGQQYSVQGVVDVAEENSGKKYTFDKVVLLSGGRKVLGLDGTAFSNADQVNVDVKVNYGEENVALKLDAKRIAERHYILGVSAQPSKNPEIGFDLKWEYSRDQNNIEHSLVFIHGPDLTSKVNRLTLHEKASFKKDPEHFHLSGVSELTYPAVGGVLKSEVELSDKSIEFDVEVKYEKFKFGSELSAKRDISKPGDYEIEFEAEVLENSIEIKSKRVILGEHKNKYKNSLELKPGGKYEVDATVVYNVKPHNIDMSLDADIKLNNKKVKADTGLQVNPQKVNSHAQITLDNVKYVDFVLRVQRGNNPKGNLNLNLKNYLTAVGQFSFQNGKGNANFDIDIPKINRKIKGSGDVSITGTRHAAIFELLYDAGKDPNKKVKLSTDTDISKEVIDTKNIVEVHTYKIEVNAKYTHQGTLTDGKQTFAADVTLPNGRYIVFKGDRAVTRKNDKFDGHANIELTDSITKGGQSRKIIYNGEAHNFDYETKTYDGKHTWKLINFDGSDLDVDVVLKHLPKGTDKKLSEVQVELGGSSIPKKSSVHVQAEYGAGVGEWTIKSSVGDNLTLQGNGNFVRGNNVDKPSTFEATVDVKIPSEKLKNIKLQVSDSLLTPKEVGGVFDYIQSYSVIYNDDQALKLDSHIKHLGIADAEHSSEGTAKVAISVLNNPPLIIGSTYKHNPLGQTKQESASFDVSYGEKNVGLELDSNFLPDLSSVNINAKATTPVDKYRRIDLQFSHQREDKDKHRKTNAVLIVDGTRYTIDSETKSHEISPNVDIIDYMHIVFTCPEGKTELIAKIDVVGPGEYKGEWKLESPKGFVAVDSHVNLESIDNFVITVNFDSDKVKHRKIHAEIANKPTAKAGKKIIVTVTSEGKNIVAGSTNYKKREEDGKVIVEGNGSLKIGDSTKSSSFKYTRQKLTKEADGEDGVAVFLNTNFGSSAIVGELKLTNKEIHVLNSYCEQSKDCAHFKLQSNFAVKSVANADHQLTVEVDLKKFNVPVEFGLKTSTQIKELSFDHTASLYLHSSKDKSQYTYQLYAHPGDSAAILTLPSRELAVILTTDWPSSKQGGAYKFDVSLYLDRKNKPTEKTTLAINGDVSLHKNAAAINGEAKFTYPSQPKELSVKGNVHYGGDHLLDASLDVDVFAKKSQKISAVAKLSKVQLAKGYNVTGVIEVNSRGQQLKVDLKNHLVLSTNELGFGSFLSYTDQHQKPKTVGVFFSANSKESHFLVQAPNIEVVRADTTLELSKNLQKVDTEVIVLNNKPIVINFEARDFNTFKYAYYPKNDPNTKLTANGRVVLGQLAEIHADAYKDGTKKDLFRALVYLDDNKFLKPDFSYNKNNIVEVVNAYREHIINYIKQLKEVVQDVGEEVVVELKDLVDHLKKAQPNLKPLLDYYDSELTKLKNELHADQAVKDIQAAFNKLFGGIITAIVNTAKLMTERVQELFKSFNEIVIKVTEAIKASYPQIKESVDKIFKAGLNVFDAVLNLSLTYFKAFLNIINEHQKELNEIATVASELVQDVARIIFKGAADIEKELKDFVTLLIQQIKALPIYEFIQLKYREIIKFEVPPAVHNAVKDAVEYVKVILPTEELRKLVDAVYDYILKHVKHEKVDDVSEIKNIYRSAVNAIQSVVSLLQTQATTENVSGFLEARIPFDFSFVRRIPGIFSLKVSVFNLLRNRELPKITDLYYAYRPPHCFTDIFPPFSKTGFVISGGHFFTFDGRQVTLPGSCDYVLAQDIQDGNFSVVASLKNGVLNGITITEPNESITIKTNGEILINGQPADYPAKTNNLQAFLTSPTVNVKSSYGVHLMCSEKSPLICSIHVSGFYFGKLRGILGDGNNEPWDDFTLPSGKVTENEAEFANAYKLNPGCPDAATPPDDASQRSPVCTEYFSGSSPMSGCFNYVNPAPYRHACDHASQSSPEGPCLISVAYYGACFEARAPISIPPACGKCKVGNQKIAIDDTFSVKIPNKEADIIFVVEQELSNEKIYKELVIPLMTELKNELKHAGLTDVKFGLIGYSDKMKWPQHYTVGGNRNIEGEAKNIEFKKKDPILSWEEVKGGKAEDKLKYLKQRVDVELGTFTLTDAYVEAIRYPYRPEAAKVVIGVLSSPCEKTPLPLSLQHLRILMGHKVYQDLGLTYYQISPLDDLQVSGKPQKNIVGYDYDAAYTFADAKKKPIEGSTEIRNNLVQLSNDVCSGFAVNSGGAAFSSHNFAEAKPNQKKQFIQVVARRVTDGISNVELEEDCVCQQHHGIIARAECKIINRKEQHGRSSLARHVLGFVKG